ncbi:phage tail protein [Bacillus sp. OTU530]|uniref:phage tail protein n=1 Tax=Bacillus sp. OTU530 TaxID=3043862 RepID=UPI00313DAC29
MSNGSDGQIRIDTKIEQNNVNTELRQLQREISNMGKELQLANTKALMPFQKQMFEVEKKFHELGSSMGSFTGTNAEFMAQVKQLGAEYKTASENMMKADTMARMSLIRTAGVMMNMSSQASKISANYQRMANPLYNVNRAGLAVADSLNRIANNGNAAVLALRMLGPNANMKQLSDMVRMINQGLMRFQVVALAAAISSVLLYGALHKANMAMNPQYAAAYTNMINSLKKAFEPMVQVFAAVMIPVYKFITAIANMIIKFNEAHPTLAKIIQGFLMLIPLLTLILSPLAIGIGLVAGMQAAFASLWTIIGPLVTGLAAMSGTVLLVAGVIVALTAGITYLWKQNEGFRNGVLSAWSAIKQKAIEVFGFIPSILAKAAAGFSVLKTAITSAFQGDFSQIGAIFAKIAPMIIGVLIGGIPSVILAASRYLPAIAQVLVNNMGVISNVVNNIVSQFVTTITTALPQVISVGLQILTSLINGITQAIPIVVPALISTFTTIINFITQTISTLLPLILNTGVKILMGIINGMVQNLPLIINAALQIVTMLSNFLVQNLPLLINAGIQILMALINGIMQMLPQLVQLALTLITSISNMLIQNLPLIIDAGVQILVSLVDGIIQMLPSLIDAAINLIVSLVDALISQLPQIIDAGVELLMALIDGIVQVLPQLINCAIDLIVKVAAALIQNLPKIIDAGVKLILALIQGILQLAGQLGSTITSDIIPKIVDTLKAVDLVGVGKNIIQGLINGIGSMVGAVASKIQEVAGNIKDKITGALGIHSPSRWMRDMVGKNMMLGWQIGIDKEKIPMLQKAAEMATWMMPDVPPLSLGATTGGTNNVTNNTPIAVTLNYSGNAGQTDLLAMVDFLESELERRFSNRMFIMGVNL